MKRPGDGARLAKELYDRANARAFYRKMVCGSELIEAFDASMARYGSLYFPDHRELAEAWYKGNPNNGKP